MKLGKLNFYFYCQGEETENEEDPDPNSCVASEDPSLRFKWIAFLESSQKGVVGDLTWDKVLWEKKTALDQ